MADGLPAKIRAADPELVHFAKRAAQLDQVKPIIAYWLRFYILKTIMDAKMHLSDAECMAYVTNLIPELERTRKQSKGEGALEDEQAAYAYCEQFALQIFAKADRELIGRKMTKNTADTFRAAVTFFDMLKIWKENPDPEITAKHGFAKFCAWRILKAFKENKDPNITVPLALEQNDPEVQTITQSTEILLPQNPYQSYVESAPGTSAQPSPTFSAPKVSPPPNLPSAPTGYDSHRDVSPMSQTAGSRQGSVGSAGGGYFPRVDVPTFTADNATPNLPTAASIDDEPMTSPFENSSPPTGSELPQAPQVPDPQDFYQNTASPPSVHQQPPQPQPRQPMFQPSPQQPTYTSPQQPQQPPAFQAPQQPFSQYPQQPPQQSQQFPQSAPFAPPALEQGPLRTDEEAVMQAQKHAKWAISALNFEDVNTAVEQLRVALRALGAS